ncbi:MAG: IS66 family insertion sequence element accessory protein TnpB [Bacteroides thetaiotaomicron]
MVTIRTREGLCIQKKGLDYQGLKTLVEKLEELMLSINGLHNFYYLPELHDMRCKAQRICEIIRGRYHRDPLNGDVYMFMSKDQRKVRMIHYERNAYYLHEKSFIKGYKFMKIERKNDVTVYKIDWKDLVTILETPVITSIRI